VGFTLAMPLGRKTLKIISHLNEIKHEKLCVACGMIYTQRFLAEQLMMWAVSFLLCVCFVSVMCLAPHKVFWGEGAYSSSGICHDIVLHTKEWLEDIADN
jgi:hypothetical protein